VKVRPQAGQITGFELVIPHPPVREVLDRHQGNADGHRLTPRLGSVGLGWSRAGVVADHGVVRREGLAAGRVRASRWLDLVNDEAHQGLFQLEVEVVDDCEDALGDVARGVGAGCRARVRVVARLVHRVDVQARNGGARCRRRGVASQAGRSGRPGVVMPAREFATTDILTDERRGLGLGSSPWTVKLGTCQPAAIQGFLRNPVSAGLWRQVRSGAPGSLCSPCHCWISVGRFRQLVRRGPYGCGPHRYVRRVAGFGVGRAIGSYCRAGGGLVSSRACPALRGRISRSAGRNS
jgi:hypothetical protein